MLAMNDGLMAADVMSARALRALLVFLPIHLESFTFRATEGTNIKTNSHTLALSAFVSVYFKSYFFKVKYNMLIEPKTISQFPGIGLIF